MEREPFFTRDGSRLIPNKCAAGPWTAGSLHGRVTIGLLAAEIERQCGDPAYMPARLTVDLYRAPSLEPLEVVARLVRDGHRIRVADAELFSEGRSAGRASCQMLRRTENAPTKVWSPPDWSVPSPAELADPGDIPETMWGMWSLRPISGDLMGYGHKRTWLREVRPLVAGEPITPFYRVAAGADYVSAMANRSGPYPEYINSDLTLYLHRLPVGEYIGYETIAHGATDGVAVGECHLYDEQGRIGWGSVCALAQTKPPTGVLGAGA